MNLHNKKSLKSDENVQVNIGGSKTKDGDMDPGPGK